jgi:hypothetical protein
MSRWHLAALTLGAAALLFTARPAQAQVWVGGGPVVVGPAWGGPAWGVGPVWGARYVGPTWGWGPRRYYRPYRRGWYGAVRGPRGRVVVAGRRW